MPKAKLADTSTLLARPRGILLLCALLYLAAALHCPLLSALGWPAMEVLWSALLIPTFVLAFYYGWRGAAAAIGFALLLFLGSEWLSHSAGEFHGERLVHLATVFLALLTLGIATGGLAEALRREHGARITAERRAAISELVLALQHEINNPLAALLMEAEMLQGDPTRLSQEQSESVARICEQARRIERLIARVAELEEPRSVEYLEGRKMTDLSGA
jgi:signal transduction histidine kinase